MPPIEMIYTNMSLRIAMLPDPTMGKCAACKQHKRLSFETYREADPCHRWRICYTCFRLPEERLTTALSTTPAVPFDPAGAEKKKARVR